MDGVEIITKTVREIRSHEMVRTRMMVYSLGL